MSSYVNYENLTLRVVNSGPFYKKIPCNHIINIKKIKSFSGEVQDSVIRVAGAEVVAAR